MKLPPAGVSPPNVYSMATALKFKLQQSYYTVKDMNVCTNNS